MKVKDNYERKEEEKDTISLEGTKIWLGVVEMV